ncbi:MAG: cupredoxin domain-containing protein [Luteitalea sp.]|nr:cupredoxin domain-containing protein [Acidobacteriota bacterium]
MSLRLPARLTRRRWLGLLGSVVAVPAAGQPDPDTPGRQRIELTARKYRFEPEVIDVRRNDVVRLTVTSLDIAHSFTVDAYRIQKRIAPGAAVTFEFRADEVGRFPFYCSMRLDAGCQEMRGELIVR